MAIDVEDRCKVLRKTIDHEVYADTDDDSEDYSEIDDPGWYDGHAYTDYALGTLNHQLDNNPAQRDSLRMMTISPSRMLDDAPMTMKRNPPTYRMKPTLSYQRKMKRICIE